jgi:hypothetical protein
VAADEAAPSFFAADARPGLQNETGRTGGTHGDGDRAGTRRHSAVEGTGLDVSGVSSAPLAMPLQALVLKQQQVPANTVPTAGPTPPETTWSPNCARYCDNAHLPCPLRQRRSTRATRGAEAGSAPPRQVLGGPVGEVCACALHETVIPLLLFVNIPSRPSYIPARIWSGGQRVVVLPAVWLTLRPHQISRCIRWTCRMARKYIPVKSYSQFIAMLDRCFRTCGPCQASLWWAHCLHFVLS